MPDRPLLIFDGNCGFCRIWIAYWKRLTGEFIDFAPSQEVARDFPRIPPEEFDKSVQLALPGGEVLHGARAVFQTLSYSPEYRILPWAYRHVPGFAAITEFGYGVIAAHRNIAYWVTRALWGREVFPSSYDAVEWLFLRALALVYLAAFLSLAPQIPGLIGSAGILPAARYLGAVKATYGAASYWTVPTLFWIDASDGALMGAAVAGIALSALLLAGLLQRTALVLLFLLYLSFSTAGQEFLSFQWDALLLEAGFLAIFLGSSRLVVWLYRWLLFRLMFLSGAVKLLSHDPTWRSLDAMRFHYWTQPLPSPLAWYMNQLPAAFQRFSTGVVFFVELFAPFLVFAPKRLRHFGAACIVFLQTLIIFTGNYAFFNWLTLALCLFLFDDYDLRWLRLPRRMVKKIRTSPRVAIPLVVLIAAMTLAQLSGTFLSYVPGAAGTLLRMAAPFGIVNSYGLFAVMTTSRPEIIVQGSNDGSNWQDYEFRYKPGNVQRAPMWVAPHQPRLDWQMWFASLSNFQNNPWFVNFMVRLLDGDAAVLHLLARNPFPSAPPRYVRALLYEYRFTDFAERAKTGAWWKREEKGLYFPAIRLRDLRR